jgi:hypothetical protein
MTREDTDGARRRERIERLRARIASLDLICPGNLARRTKVCGKPNCRCAADPGARHGPYWEWTRREHSRLVHSVISPTQAKMLGAAINNGRRIRRLLTQWERESARIIAAEAAVTRYQPTS